MTSFILVGNKDNRKLTDSAKDLYYEFIDKYNYSEEEITWHLAKNGIEFQGVENILFDFQDYILDHMYEYGNYSYEDGDYELIEESKKSARKSLKESKKWVSDVADDLFISFEDILNVFEEYGYGKKEAQDFYDSKWDDVGDVFNEMAELAVLFELENWEESKESARNSIKEERYNVELTDYSGSIVDEETFDKKSDAIQWAKDNGRNCYARIWDNEEGKTVKEWKVKSIKEQFVGKGKGGYRKPDKTKFNSGIGLDSNGVKHTVIFDTRVEDFIVWVDDDNYLMWNVSSPQSLLNNLSESDLDENLILDIVTLWEKLPKKRIKN